MVLFFSPLAPYDLRLTVFLNSGVVGGGKQSADGGIWGDKIKWHLNQRAHAFFQEEGKRP
jgi:hypothetical protein